MRRHYDVQKPCKPYSFWRCWVAPAAHQQHCSKYARQNKKTVERTSLNTIPGGRPPGGVTGTGRSRQLRSPAVMMLSGKQAASLTGFDWQGKKMNKAMRVKYYGLRVWSRRFQLFLNKQPAISFAGAVNRHDPIGFRLAQTQQTTENTEVSNG